ncbi:MAG: hypothetical protein K0R38_7438 [Polyangiaceae bacterium]|jgi:hypothetical protein|nr:hypothetical protein [Polyangiaceae bacterium]
MRFIRVPTCAATLAALLLFAQAGHARSAGLAALGCDGCHSGGEPAKVTLSAEPLVAAVGEPITLTITVSQTNGPTAGFYLTTAFDSPGAFKAAEAGTALDSSGVFHATPRAGSGGSIAFKAQWTAAEATGVAFDVYALSSNADRTNRGDGAGAAHLQLVVGCSGRAFYIDQDGDGFGSTDPAYRSRQECEAPAGYAAAPGDCDDFNPRIYPAASEQCDLRDNDCDGNVDEDVVSQLFCEDADGDGHGVMGRTTFMDCKPAEGFGTCDGDCDDGDALFHPGAKEVCDGRDNDCNGTTDEGVQRVCGVGLCARKASGCNAADCTPGEPFPETCNGYDDDCDGVIDNGDPSSLCAGPGATCANGHCSDERSEGGGASLPPQPDPPQEAPSGATGCDFAFHAGRAPRALPLLLATAAWALTRRSRRQ